MTAKGGQRCNPNRRRWAPVCLVFLFPFIAAADIDLEINGVPDVVAENIRLHFSRWDSLPAENLDDIRRQTRNAVHNGLHALGYYNASVNYKLDGETLILDIEPGPPVVWGNARVALETADAEAPQELQQLANNHPFQTGERINHQQYENYKRQLIARANQLGYLDAKLSQQQFTIDLQEHRARVTLTAQLGQRYRLESVSYSGSGAADELVRRIAEVPVGDWYSADTVGDIYNRLLNSGYFASVNFDVEKQAPDTARLHIFLRDLPEYRVTVGVGAAEPADAGVGLFFSLKGRRPRINERGDSLEAELRLAEPRQEVAARYRIPWPDPQDRYISWDTGYKQDETEDTETKLLTTGLSFHRVLESGWQYSYHVNVENEESQIDGMDMERQTYVLPGVSVSRRRFRGDATDPRSGYKVWLNYVASSTRLNSDTNFQRIHGGINGVYTWNGTHGLLGRMELGAVPADNFEDVPISQRFFTGGDQSIRGYEYRSISPTEDGNKTGGQYLNVASLEYRYQVLPKWRAAVFVDSGRAYNDDSEPVRTSAGIGVRWKTPVGFVAFDVAAPIDDPDEDVDNFQIHFYISTPL